MSLLSLTFHSIENVKIEWQNYMSTTLITLVENLMDVEKYILSEVDSKMINEGMNTNLLLWFDTEEKREDFIKNEFPNIEELIGKKFGDQVMIFQTFLNTKKARL